MTTSPIDQRIDRALLEQVSTQLASEIGGLQDLGVELGETIANEYYKLAAAQHDLAANTVRAIAPYVPAGTSVLEAAIRVPTLAARAAVAVASLPSLVHAIREARSSSPILADVMASVLVDDLKYGIPDATNKSGIRRWFERLFRYPEKQLPLLAALRGEVSQPNSPRPASPSADPAGAASGAPPGEQNVLPTFPTWKGAPVAVVNAGTYYIVVFENAITLLEAATGTKVPFRYPFAALVKAVGTENVVAIVTHEVGPDDSGGALVVWHPNGQDRRVLRLQPLPESASAFAATVEGWLKT